MDTTLHSELISWISSDKRNIVNVEIKEFGKMGLGLSCIKGLKQNELGLAIHKSYFLSMENCFNDLFMKENVYSKSTSLSIYQKFIMYLAKEITEGEKSKWHIYFKSLPQNLTNLILWSEKDIKKLVRKDLVSSIMNKKAKLQNEFEEVKEFMKTSSKFEVIEKYLSLEKYFLLFSIIESRSITYKTKYDINSQIGALIPLYDMANHDFLYEVEDIEDKMEKLNLNSNSTQKKQINPQEYFYFDTKKFYFVIKAYRDHNKDDQLFINYSGKPNIHFLEYYGFVPNFNPNNVFSFNIPLNEDYISNFFSGTFKDEFLMKLKVCHLFLPNLVSRNVQPGYMEGMGMKKKFQYKLSETIEFIIDNTDLGISWQFITLIKIFSLPKEGGESFLPTSKNKKGETEEDDEEDILDSSNLTNKLDLLDEKYFYNDLHKKNFDKILQNVLQKIRKETYLETKSESIENGDRSVFDDLAESFVTQDTKILDNICSKFVIQKKLF